ncbi:MAG: hypothetical protein OXF02_07495 [Simkaniaceae bacterium]|nr:hypothetical protein [Simkaniaceae bacterium]
MSCFCSESQSLPGKAGIVVVRSEREYCAVIVPRGGTEQMVDRARRVLSESRKISDRAGIPPDRASRIQPPAGRVVTETPAATVGV